MAGIGASTAVCAIRVRNYSSCSLQTFKRHRESHPLVAADGPLLGPRADASPSLWQIWPRHLASRRRLVQDPAMSRILIRRATCVLPNEILKVDVLLDDGKIAMIDPARHARHDELIEAAGLHLLPGAIDDQVHFREPGLAHKEDLRTGSMACAKGGITTFLEMPNTKPATTTRALLDAKLARAAEQCLVNYGFYIGATGDNLDELKLASRTPGIKIFIGSSTGDLLVDDQATLEADLCARPRLPITAHCEDETRVRANAARLGGGRQRGRPFADPRRRGGGNLRPPRLRAGRAPPPPLPPAAHLDRARGRPAARIPAQSRRSARS